MVQTARLASEPVGQWFGSSCSSRPPPAVRCQSLGRGQFPQLSGLISVPGAPAGWRAGSYLRGAVSSGASNSRPDAQAVSASAAPRTDRLDGQAGAMRIPSRARGVGMLVASSSLLQPPFTRSTARSRPGTATGLGKSGGETPRASVVCTGSSFTATSWTGQRRSGRWPPAAEWGRGSRGAAALRGGAHCDHVW